MKGAPVLGAASRLAKLRAMSVGEVAERVRYRLVLSAERRQQQYGLLSATVDALGGRLVPDLRGRHWQQRLLESRARSRCFFPGAQDRDAMRALFATGYRAELADTLAQAEATRAHRFSFFGQQFEPGRDIDWQVDPVTGQRWPSRFHADVPVHGGDIGYGDVKYVWEINRQQYLIDLGKAWYLTGQEESVPALRHLVRSWIAGNPYAVGVNWSCALEPAFRAFSWLWAYHLAIDAIDDAFHVEWLASLHDHGRFLERHLELYSSPYNHLIGEAAALYALGTCFPEFAASPRWRRRARQVLDARLDQQFYADGGSVEQSTFYHHATLGFYLLAALLARSAGEELSPAIWESIERAIDFSAQMMQPDGRIPEIGGADDGKPIRMEHRTFWDFRPYLAIGAVLFNRPDLKSLAGRFHEDALWLLGPDGLRAFAGLPDGPPPRASTALTHSGYVVSRSDWSPHADYVCFDVGEQAAGMRSDGVPNSMHGHADCLSIVLWLGGRRVLVDSGLFAYNCGGEWESHFRETAAHNTARIDGRDQARHIRKMAWSHSYRAVLDATHADGGEVWAIGSHDGYARGPAGVTHRRAVWLRPGGYLLVYDVFTGVGDHAIDVNWQFAPGALQLADGNRAVFGDDVEVAWIGTGAWTADTRCGGARPSDGWICPSLGIREAAPRLTLEGRMVNGQRTALLTVLADARRVRVQRAEGGCALTEMTAPSRTDWVTAPGATAGGPIDTDALIALCRIGPDGVEPLRAGGTYVRVDRDAARLLAARVRGHA